MAKKAKTKSIIKKVDTLEDSQLDVGSLKKETKVSDKKVTGRRAIKINRFKK